ncbi:hypothetical protein E2C01_080172 [Portunus trituberculatus]|uniref:Uncharacterized protein n=1 Tax=Portunus trituberculatus TaxID=210409 RepID=A0A5B7ILG9_PORTR|nr:hypothetical protein [Portunus trituberculatus]
MMQVVLRELGHDRVEMTGREWMVELLGLCRETNGRMIEAVKEFLERMCVLDAGTSGVKDGAADTNARRRRNSWVTCSIKIKIKLLLVPKLAVRGKRDGDDREEGSVLDIY